jgi:hypothetical protein
LNRHGRSIIYESRKAHMEWSEAFNKPRLFCQHVMAGIQTVSYRT